MIKYNETHYKPIKAKENINFFNEEHFIYNNRKTNNNINKHFSSEDIQTTNINKQTNNIPNNYSIHDTQTININKPVIKQITNNTNNIEGDNNIYYI